MHLKWNTLIFYWQWMCNICQEAEPIIIMHYNPAGKVANNALKCDISKFHYEVN